VEGVRKQSVTYTAEGVETHVNSISAVTVSKIFRSIRIRNQNCLLSIRSLRSNRTEENAWSIFGRTEASDAESSVHP